MSNFTEGDVPLLISELMRQPDVGWAMGPMGATAEFHAVGSKFGQYAPYRAITARGAIEWNSNELGCLAAQPFAYPTSSSWAQGVALGYFGEPDSSLRVVTELGLDDGALNDCDRNDYLFDLGVGMHGVAFCIRSAHRELGDALRAICGRKYPTDDQSLQSLILEVSPVRVVKSRFGRIEVYQSIPKPGGSTPLGPHTHFLPKLLATQRYCSANIGIEAGFNPVGFVYPPHPLYDLQGNPKPFDEIFLDQFTSVVSIFADPQCYEVMIAGRNGSELKIDDENLHRARKLRGFWSSGIRQQMAFAHAGSDRAPAIATVAAPHLL